MNRHPYLSIAAAAVSLVVGLASADTVDAAVESAMPYQFDATIVNNSLAVSPDGRTAVASDSRMPGVRLYDLKSGRLLTTLGGFVTPRNSLFTPDGKTLLISDSTLGEVRIFDGHTWARQGAIAIGAGSFGTAVDRNGNRLYVNNEAANTVTVVDLVSRHTLAVLTGFAQPRQGIKLNPDGTLAYVLNKDLSIAVVDLRTATIVRRMGTAQ